MKKQPIPNSAKKVLSAMFQVQQSIIPHMQELGAAGKTLGIDMAAFVTDISPPERAASMRRSLSRMDAALTQLEAIAAAHAPAGPIR
jgi:hypothetical protein